MKITKTLLAASLISAVTPASAGEVEVLHWWTAGGEANAISVLKDMLEQQGYSWIDFGVEGGGGESAMRVLRTRAVSGNPPSAANIKGPDIQEWARLGFLTNLNSVANPEHWDDVIPKMITNVMKYDNHYVAVPVNVHRVNWLWANSEVFAKAGAKIPTSMDEFFTAADKIKAIGLIPLAHGSQPWQNATLFEVIALDVLGAKDYIKAFVDLDMDTLGGEKMIEVFTQFKRVRSYVDNNSPGRDWMTATSMVIKGEAGMQIMGDWAKGEFSAAGKVPGKDYVCAPAFGTAGKFTYNVDSFAFFDLQDEENFKAQQALASTILDPKFQEVFNLNKGSIPVRLDMDMSHFDQCALDSMREFKSSAKTGDLVPSMAHGMSTTSYVQSAMFDVITNFFNNPNETPKEAVQRLTKVVKSSM
ncbi:ABC transporter substrate-binding protein [Vibrio diazotrophicus]|uniref:ABC transporter substrate-binding protein n=1 Tax=Vibrio diazotrophicus TaxID=685 RepID=UPI00142D27A8|nr:ABC transporter substrate-binding protein [Vibrio diazotrophicus]NIY94268.1 carbohydrate ABC transporter substrate-binding protein [Vibrio diazotrophicus]